VSNQVNLARSTININFNEIFTVQESKLFLLILLPLGEVIVSLLKPVLKVNRCELFGYTAIMSVKDLCFY